YAFAALAFFIPVALVAAELATTYPRNGGLYIWIKEAFGQRIGFASIWLQCFYNLIWFPTILLFIASTFAYLINPHLTHNKLFLTTTIISLFWLFTGLNCLGLRVASIISTIGAILGTLLPMLGIIVMAAIWLLQGHAPVNDFHAPMLPDFDSLNPFSMFIVVLFGLIGIEMSAVHAGDVENPKKDYPKAIAWSAVMIMASLVLSSLSILVVVPLHKLNLVTGLVHAYDLFFKAYHLEWMTSMIASLIIIGGLSSVSTWMIGPVKGLMVAAHQSEMPHAIYKINRYQAPYRMLVIQAMVFSVLSFAFVYFPSMNAAYWWLSDISAQLALIVYMIMFAAFIKLRLTEADKPRVYHVPGGKIGMWVIAGTGFGSSLFGFLIGFLSPSQIPATAKNLSLEMMVGFLIVLIAVPFFAGAKTKKTR
ncbi:MAG: amino acid permease, partial [Chitinophagia bacterium]|nr:amino acid permease [Chitinophagia bacterium]